MTRETTPTFAPSYIRDLSERVYRDQLGAADVASMIEKDRDSGEKLRARAAAYDRLTRAYLKALGIEPSPLNEGLKDCSESLHVLAVTCGKREDDV